MVEVLVLISAAIVAETWIEFDGVRSQHLTFAF